MTGAPLGEDPDSVDSVRPVAPVPGSRWQPAWLNRRVIAWASYDFASSAYFGVVPPLVFPVFYLSVVSTGEARFLSWGAAVSVSLVLAAVLAPLIGNLVDRHGGRWHLLAVATVVCCMATASLYLVRPGQVFLAVAAFAVAQSAYLLSTPLYESYLPSIAKPGETGRVSTFAWASGFLGGIVTILAILPLARGGAGPDNVERFQASFLVVAGFFALGSIPALRGMRRLLESRGSRSFASRTSPWTTLRNWRDHRELFKLILAFYLVNDGMVTIAAFAAEFFRTNFGATPETLLLLLLVYHLVAVPATMAFGLLADRWTHRRAIFLSLSLWSAALLVMAVADGPWVPIVAVTLFGTVYGSTISLFRSLVAQMVPKEKAGEFFGFNTFAGRLSAAAGPLLYGTVATATGSQRAALTSVLAFLVAGACVLARVKLPDLRRQRATRGRARLL